MDFLIQRLEYLYKKAVLLGDFVNLSDMSMIRIVKSVMVQY